jgi:hypothetical protein
MLCMRVHAPTPTPTLLCVQVVKGATKGEGPATGRRGRQQQPPNVLVAHLGGWLSVGGGGGMAVFGFVWAQAALSGRVVQFGSGGALGAVWWERGPASCCLGGWAPAGSRHAHSCCLCLTWYR